MSHIRVHVFGAPGDVDEDCGLQVDETTCEVIHDSHAVIYHLGATQLTRGGWACADCGVTSANPDSRFAQ